MLCTYPFSLASGDSHHPVRARVISSGFLPVIYSWARSKRQAQPLSLPADSEEEPAAGVKAEIPQQHLEGWKVLLLWFPAACDLAGTTVRPLPTLS